MSSAIKYVATATVAVLGGYLLVGLLPLSSGDESPVAGAPVEVEAAIDWRSGVVDLKADGMTLQVGDDIFTTEGVDVRVDSYDGNLSQWSLYPSWVEDGQTFWLYVDFQSEEDTWEAWPWVWREGVMGPGDHEYEWAVEGGYLDQNGDGVLDFEPDNALLEFSGPSIRMPLGEAYVGDWHLETNISEPTCEGSLETIGVSLTFENLRLAVSPRQPSAFDEVMYDMFHRGTMLGEIVNGHVEPPRSRLLDCAEAD